MSNMQDSKMYIQVCDFLEIIARVAGRVIVSEFKVDPDCVEFVE
jgi:hypothetical protein